MIEPQELVHFRAGHIFTSDDCVPLAQSLLTRGGLIEFVGSDSEADTLPGVDRVVDLGGACVIPGIVDGHSHVHGLGQSLSQVDLFDAPDLSEMQRRLAAAAAADPEAPHIQGHGWLLPQFGGAAPHRNMIDSVVADPPVYLSSNDSHSALVNSAALQEMGIDESTPDPEGGTIVRDQNGEATGLLLETAALVMMSDIIERNEDDVTRDAAVRDALNAYLATGVTAVADLGLRDTELDTLERAWRADELTIPVAGYLRVETSRDSEALEARVRYAAETRDRLAREACERGDKDPALRLAGIKIWVDGVIDSGTAAMHQGFSDGSRPPGLWDSETLSRIVSAADGAGLQVAMHAIGDAAVDLALDSIEAARLKNGNSGVFHRIEHLEVVDRASFDRIVSLGAIVSVQPVHADPVIQTEWRRRLGDRRVEHGFPWADLEASGAHIILGTDAPTAPYNPLPNLFVAATRRSPGYPELEPNHSEQHLSLTSAIIAATRKSAGACGWGSSRGVLRAGFCADFLVLNQDPFVCGPEVLAEASPAKVFLGGVDQSSVR